MEPDNDPMEMSPPERDADAGDRILEDAIMFQAPTNVRVESVNELKDISHVFTSADDDSLDYNLDKCDYNLMIIINNAEFKNNPRREGTNKDVDKLKDTFEKFNFKVITLNDLTRDEIITILKESLVDKNLSRCGVVAVVALTHGYSEGRLQSADDSYSERDIIACFSQDRNPTLRNKPKLIFIQACRGHNISVGLKTGPKATTQPSTDNTYYKAPPSTLPDDTLVFYSSFYGNTSYLNMDSGSWLIQVLCDKVEELGDKEDFKSILTKVKREIAINKGRKNKNDEIEKQMTVVNSNLSKFLYLKKAVVAASSLEIDTSSPPNPTTPSKVTCDHIINKNFEYFEKLARKNVHKSQSMQQSLQPLINTAEECQEDKLFNGIKKRLAHEVKTILEKNAKTCLDCGECVYPFIPD